MKTPMITFLYVENVGKLCDTVLAFTGIFFCPVHCLRKTREIFARKI